MIWIAIISLSAAVPAQFYEVASPSECRAIVRKTERRGGVGMCMKIRVGNRH